MKVLTLTFVILWYHIVSLTKFLIDLIIFVHKSFTLQLGDRQLQIKFLRVPINHNLYQNLHFFFIKLVESLLINFEQLRYQ